jgi:SPP1 gp7 family putative phage head morphogenesis protein
MFLLGKPNRRRGKPPRPIPPRGIEVSYTRFLLDLVDTLDRLIDEMVRPAAVAELSRVRTDAWGDDLELLVQDVLVRFGVLVPAESIRSRVTTAGRQVANHTGNELGRMVKSVLGVDVLQSEPWLEDELASFRRENVALIKDLTETHLRRIEQLLADGVRRGDGWKAIAAELQRQTGITKNRAKLIAVDQVGKAQGRMTELRQRGLGINEYEWSTVKDSRVRGRPGGAWPDSHPSHWAREGKTFSWDKPPEGGHPGEAIRCRCIAQPVIPEIDDLFT